MRAASLCLVAVALAASVATAAPTGGTRSCASADARFAAAWESRRGQPLREVPVSPPIFNGHPRYARPYSLAIIHFALRVFHNAETNAYALANAKVAENCRFYIENTDVRDDRDSFYWNVGELCRAMLHYGSKGDVAPGRLSPAAEAAFLEMAFGYCHDMSRLADAACDGTKTWRVYESENHHVQRASALWQLMHVLLKADPAYGARVLGDGGTLRAHYAAWEAFFCAWMRERAKRSMFIEVQSRGYGIHTIKNIYPLHDFSDNPATRRLARDFLDLFWALWAQEQITGASGGGMSRVYPSGARTTYSSAGTWAYWYFGLNPSLNRSPGDMDYVCLDSSYRPHPLIGRLAADAAARGVYEIEMRPLGWALPEDKYPDYRPDPEWGRIYRYTYATPDFIVGTQMYPQSAFTNWCMISSQNRFHGVVYGPRDAQLLPIPAAMGRHVKTAALPSTAYNGFWSMQKNGTLLTRKNRHPRYTGSMCVWFSAAGGVDHVEKDGDWYFTRCGGAYSAVRVAQGAARLVAAGPKAEMPCERNGKFLVCDNQWAVVIVETARACDFADEAAFRAKVKSTSFALTSSTLDYIGIYGNHFHMLLDRDDGSTIDGEPYVKKPAWSVHSPFVKMHWLGDIAEVTFGGETIRLDFRAAIAADKLPSVPANLDFEEGAKSWRVPRTKWRVEDGAGRGGSKGLVCANDNPHSYSFPGQRIALEGGAVYRFGCWVKAEKVMKDGKAILPSVSLDWSDANGKWLSAAYAYPVASNEPNTDGWVRYEGVTSPLPDEAVSGTLLCFLPRGATGKVQFDDYFFKPEDAHPVDWLMSSAYRNTAADGTVTFHASLYINKVKHPLDSLVPQFIYKANDGRVVAVPPDEMSSRAASVAILVERMAEGPQTVVFALRNRTDGKELGRAECTFTRGTVARRVAFDKYKRTLVDGKPFLPLGMYASVLSDEAISKFTNGVFNCIMPYNPKREQLDAAHAAGLKVIYSVKDMVWGSKFVRKGMATREKSLAAIREVVEAVKGHPALLAWYINDEAPERQIGPLREVNEMIHALDPDHPTWAVTDKPWHVRPFVGSYDCIGMDPYPIGNNRGGIDIAGGWALEARAGSFDVVPMWHVPQCFNWKWYRGSVTNPEFRFPTREELDSMFWQAIAAGANGLVPYAFHGMRKNLKGADYDKAMGDVKAVMASVKRREAIILSDPGPSATANATNLLCRTWTAADGETWLLLSNANRAKVTATVKLGASFREVMPEAGVSATLTSPAVLSVELAPLASGFVRLVR